LEVQPEYRGNGPGRLGEVDDAVEGQRGEQLLRELLVVERGQAEGRAIGSPDLGLGKSRRVAAAVVVAAGGREERHDLQALRDLELGGYVRDGEAARSIRVAETHDIEH